MYAGCDADGVVATLAAGDRLRPRIGGKTAPIVPLSLPGTVSRWEDVAVVGDRDRHRSDRRLYRDIRLPAGLYHLAYRQRAGLHPAEAALRPPPAALPYLPQPLEVRSTPDQGRQRYQHLARRLHGAGPQHRLPVAHIRWDVRHHVLLELAAGAGSHEYNPAPGWRCSLSLPGRQVLIQEAAEEGRGDRQQGHRGPLHGTLGAGVQPRRARGRALRGRERRILERE